MSKKVKQPYLDAWKGLLRSHAATVARIESRLAETGSVPLTSYDVLLELSNAPEQKLRMAELAERVILSRSGLTRLVDRLEKEGYLVRESIKEDRRGTAAVLTEKGLEALREAWPVYAEGIKQDFATFLSRDEAEVIAKALARVATGIPINTVSEEAKELKTSSVSSPS